MLYNYLDICSWRVEICKKILDIFRKLFRSMQIEYEEEKPKILLPNKPVHITK